MDNYDLLSLSWIEFEDLTRDLLQAEFGLYIESFMPGKDDGIDLRFAFSSDKKSIVQCKRLSNFNSLYSQLKKEKQKLLNKKLERYYISTTAGLTPQGKNRIYELFYPFIKDEADIFGKDDIINLISKHQKIEEKYNKLWLTNTTVLRKLLNAKVYNSSTIQMQQIKDDVKIYVHNESYKNAQAVLDQYHYIIISGIPGIGKTTLARMLVYNFIASGIDDLIYISTNIGEALEAYHESTKQVFLFDDFLGKNFLEDRLERNEDQELLSFIKRIKNSKNKYFILTTREYILKQAQQKYELLNRHNLDIAKCIIDLSLYTPIIRANILYNHLYFSNMPKKYLEELIKSQRYFTIINHKNYNPRIIESILDKEEWDSIPTGSYYNSFLSYFDNPISVWKHAFEQQISLLGRIIIVILGSINGLIGLGNLKTAVKNYLKSDNISFVADFDIDFEKSLKELTGSFLRIEKDDKNIYALEHLNPSIADFIHSYFLDNKDLLKSVIENCTYLDQILTAYQIFNGPVPDEIRIISENEISKRFNDLNIIRLEKALFFNPKAFFYKMSTNTFIDKLYYISRYLFPLSDETLLERLKNKFIQEIKNVPKDVSYRNYEKLINIYISFYEYADIGEFAYFLNNLINGSDTIDSLLETARLKDVNKEEFDKVIKNESITKKIKEIAYDDFSNADKGLYEYTRDSLLNVSEYFNVDISQYIEELDERIDDEKKSEEYMEVHKSSGGNDNTQNENDKIKELFDTLLLK
jgi:KaiC/GvpD/RAD55 family RecA-like ATPase